MINGEKAKEQAISNLRKLKSFHNGSYGADIDRAIRALEQEPKTGYWIDTGSGQECSECGEIQYGYDNFRHFCANCGAKIVKPPERIVMKNDKRRSRA